MKDVILGVQNPLEQGVHFSLRVLVLASVKVKVKESRNSPGVAQRVPGGLGSRIS
jgi:hypothetical protein